jgi:hypothetical protein
MIFLTTRFLIVIFISLIIFLPSVEACELSVKDKKLISTMLQGKSSSEEFLTLNGLYPVKTNIGYSLFMGSEKFFEKMMVGNAEYYITKVDKGSRGYIAWKPRDRLTLLDLDSSVKHLFKINAVELAGTCEAFNNIYHLLFHGMGVNTIYFPQEVSGPIVISVGKNLIIYQESSEGVVVERVFIETAE